MTHYENNLFTVKSKNFKQCNKITIARYVNMLKSRNHHKHGDRKCKRCLTNLYLQYNLDIRLQMLLTKYYLIRLAPLPAKQTLVRRRSSVISRNCSWEEHLPHSFRLNDWQDYSRCTLDSQTNV